MHPLCINCGKPVKGVLDEYLCDDCVHEAMRHKPELYARISLVGGGSFIQPLGEVGEAFANEFSADAEVGCKWTVELIEMSAAEYEALEEFAGH